MFFYFRYCDDAEICLKSVITFAKDKRDKKSDAKAYFSMVVYLIHRRKKQKQFATFSQI